MKLFRLALVAAFVAITLPFATAHGVYNASIGRWVQRDPLPYIDGPNQYEYG